jgi:MFS family permease
VGTALDRYRRVLAAPDVAPLWLAVMVARLPVGINGLAIVLAMRQETGSFAAAGAAAGAYALSLGLSSPFQARLMDRFGPRRVMPPLVAWHVGVLGTFVALLGHAPAGVLVALAGLSGLGLPPWSSVMRAMWPRLLGDDTLITTAFALDAAIVELVFIVGPLLTALAVTVASARTALLASMVLVAIGTLMLASSAAIRAWEVEVREGRGPFGALRSRGLLTVVLATLPIGFAFGAMEIALPAFAQVHGSPGDAGLLIALWALGSAVGALVYGGRVWRGPLHGRWLAFNGLLGVSLLVPLAAPSIPVLVVLMPVAGLFIAPSIASGSQLMGVLAPPGMTTEAYSWGPTAIVVGSAAGAAAAGALVEAFGWRIAVAAAGATAVAGFLLGLARRSTLRG